MVIEGALESELDDHLGYAKHDPAGRNGGNSRNGHQPKTVLTEAGPVEISMPRDRDSSFEPKIVAKRQRRLTGVEDMVISLDELGAGEVPSLTNRRANLVSYTIFRRIGVPARQHRDHARVELERERLML